MRTIPLPLDDPLLQDIQSTAHAAHLSQADVMRQSIRFGLPIVRRRLNARPFTLLEALKGLKGMEIPERRPLHLKRRV